ncbi:MAG TPA: IPT/TIG domain-containing protein [Longimicrobium sp.]|nr:IPT/TIG domain-containing protein [Longimicrobium sp.]
MSSKTNDPRRAPRVAPGGEAPSALRAGVALPGIQLTPILPGDGGTLPPRITGFTPASGPVGTAVTVNGGGFTPGGGIVTFNGTEATYLALTSTSLRTTVPPGATTGRIGVDGVFSTQVFTVTGGPSGGGGPTLTGFSPASGRPGDRVIITGTGLDTTIGVKLSGVNADFVFGAPGSIEVTVPSGAASGPFQVTTASGTATTATPFTVTGLPAVTSFFPQSGAVGTRVTVNGANFDGLLSVRFNGTRATFFQRLSNTQLQADVPAGAGSGPILVETTAGTGQSAASFVVGVADTQAPAVTVVSPAAGAVLRPGQSVTVSWSSGDNVGVASHDVLFSATGAGGPFQTVAAGLPGTQQSLAWTVPATGTSAGVVQVAARDAAGNVGRGNSGVFTIMDIPATPSVASVTPNTGSTAGGTQVTVAGSGFVAGCRVRFGGVDATQVGFAGTQQVTAVTPARAAAGSVRVEVVNPDGSSGGRDGAFTYAVPGARTPAIALTQVTVVDPDPDPLDGLLPAATSSGAEIRAGQQVVLQLEARLKDIFGNKYDDVLQLTATGVPPKATCTITPNPVHTFTRIDVTVQTALDTPPGDYTLSFTGQSLNVPNLNYGPYTFALKVDPPVRKVLLTIVPTATTTPGQPAPYAVTVRRRHLDGAPVTLTADTSRLPAGTTAQFVPNPATAGASGLALIPPATALPGTYPFTITGKAEGVEGATPGMASSVLVVRAPMLAVSVVNRVIPNDMVAVSNCPVELRRGTAVVASGTTNRFGNASLSLAGVTDGTYDFVVTPPNSTTDPVGPAIGAGPNPPERIYRPLAGTLTLSGGTAVSGSGVDVANGAVTARVQPVFIKSPNFRARTQALTLCVVHKADAPKNTRSTLQGTINSFLKAGGLSSHYVVDRDGSIVKMVHESAVAFQAGCSHWLGKDGVNEFSIGIEQVHDSIDGAYPTAQVDAVIGLIQRVRDTYGQTLPARGVVGHSDVATTGTDRNCLPADRMLGRKGLDPGPQFDWKALRDCGLGILLNTQAPAAWIYGGFFDDPRFRNLSLKLNDNDARHVYGGMTNTGITANVIAELQADLRAIGYFCPSNPTGTYDAATAAAVQQFQDTSSARGSPPPPRRARWTGEPPSPSSRRSEPRRDGAPPGASSPPHERR